ncbi:DUF1993 family protein [Novosphingobium sp. 9U]|uniref:DUF1993 domain-containing protein n=1 Tax=Novosphingobium sp. 9U TaxID=2653158 RepID=UPI0012F21135|nr:DUF1993 domain-containing protein [Novosphingobium sp. 9U]VWX46385.1 conserved hypothetical protein [Novosphingobium sp. 9U]
MSITNLLVPTFTQMLGALSGWLDKADAQLSVEEAKALPGARLAPDMFPLSTQVRFACVQALEAVHRLRGLDYPPAVAELLGEGRNADAQPGSIADAQARIAQTMAVLDALAPDALDVDPQSPIAHALPIGMVFDLTALQYARDWALGQFYFHVMTAYAILRNAGVNIGKADYIPHMLPFMRQAPAEA